MRMRSGVSSRMFIGVVLLAVDRGMGCGLLFLGREWWVGVCAEYFIGCGGECPGVGGARATVRECVGFYVLSRDGEFFFTHAATKEVG